jgi:hypothetical protein
MKSNVLCLGSNYYPTGGADSIKTTLICQAIHISGRRVLIVNRYGNIDIKSNSVKKIGKKDNIWYFFCASQFRQSHLSKRIINKIKGLINEFFAVWKLRYCHNYRVAIVNTPYFSRLLYYSIITKLVSIKLIYVQSELYYYHKNSKFGIFNNYLIDNFCYFIIDALMPISEMIIQNMNRYNPRLKYLKVPVLANYEKFDKHFLQRLSYDYFLFCAAFGYTKLYEYVIEAYLSSGISNRFKLILIGYGSDYQKSKIISFINDTGLNDRVIILESISEKALINYYKNASALLLPLEDTIRDRARFPHKVGEYCASGKLIISNMVGEIAYYFTDMKNILYSESDIKSYGNSIKWVTENKEKADVLGLNSYNLGKMEFDYRVFGSKIDGFLSILVKEDC